ncbi:hypothetical protein B0H13DRAFT_1891345 [Mycena leptocephala]|nr:hypothetical protein B0H13DRAFT_1891345 [Mycena leptocephala]
MSAPSFGDCDKDATDTQLFIDNQAGLINSTFKFECYAGPDGQTIVQKGPAFSLCGLFAGDPNLCMGGNKGQHACGGPKCQVIDWTKARAPGCPSAILEYVQVQPAGIVAPCCTSDGCSTPSDPQDTPYTCDISQKLYLCVNDGVGAECVDPKAKTICSGSFSGAGVPSGTSGSGGSQTASSGNGSRTASHPLSTSAIIGICVAGFVVLVILGLISEWMKKKRTPVPILPVTEVAAPQMIEQRKEIMFERDPDGTDRIVMSQTGKQLV